MMKKFCILVFSLIILSFISTVCYAETLSSGVCGDNLTYVLDSNGTLTISGTGDMYDFNYDGVPVVWSEYKDSITSLVIEEGVTSVGLNAFFNYYNLENIHIASSVTDIGSSSFHYTLWYENQPDGLIYIGKVLYSCKGYFPSNTSISVKEGTVSINPRTFEKQIGLVSITMPDSVTHIGEAAFAYCDNLTSLTLSKNITEIPNSMLSGCGRLTSVSIPENVTVIGDEAFYSCGIRNLEFPDKITTIGNLAFYNCNSLSRLENLPNKLQIIKAYAFSDCDNLYSVSLPDGTSVENNAFAYCERLTSFSFPSNAEFIGDGILTGCTALYDVQFGTGMFSIPSESFYGCENLKSIEVPEGITSIKDYAFYSSGLTNIKLPSTLKSIGLDAFYDCPFDSVYFNGTYYEWINIDISSGNETLLYNINYYTPVEGIHISNEEINMNINSTFNLHASVFPENATNRNIIWTSSSNAVATVKNGIVTAIKEGRATITATTEEGNFSATCSVNVIIPVSSVSISHKELSLSVNETFRLSANILPTNASDTTVYWSTSDKTVATVNNGLVRAQSGGTATITAKSKSNGKSATCMVTVHVPVTSIFLNHSSCAVSLKNKLTLEATISPDNASNRNLIWTSSDESVATVENGIVTGLKEGITTITAETEDGGLTAACVVKFIDAYAFGKLSNDIIWELEDDGFLSITGSGDITDFYTDAPPPWYSIRDRIITLEISDKITAIGSYAFAYCENLISSKLPDSIQSIGYGAFGMCSSLREINLPASLTTIGDYAFAGCVALTSVDFPELLNSIGKYAFTECIALSSVNIKDIASWCNVNIDRDSPNPLYYANQLSINGQLVSELIIPESVTEIKPYTFTGCNITDISLPVSVSIIGEGAFANCSTLKNIYYDGSYHQWNLINIGDDNQYLTNANLHAVTPLEKITLNQTSITMLPNSTYKLSVTFTPDDATYKDVKWTSSDESVATVDSNGIITAVKEGMATITCTSAYGNFTDKCTVSIKIPVSSIVLDKNSLLLKKGETFTLSAEILPENATDKGIIWTSSNTDIATVKDGLITAINTGTATITATSADGNAYAVCTVTIYIPVSGVSLNYSQYTLAKGKTLSLTATVLPADATNKTVTYSSSDSSIATVSNYGTVTAVSKGTSTITVATKDGNFTGTCTISVVTAAKSGNIGQISWIYEDDGTLTLSGKGTMPPKFEGYSSFVSVLPNVKKLVLNNGITSLSILTPYCMQLEEVIISQSVTSIPQECFSGLPVKKISVHEDNPVYKTQYDVLFTKDMTELIYYAPKKTNINYTVPSGVRKIKDYAFENCKTLSELFIPSSVEVIETNALIEGNSLSIINVSEDNLNYSSENGILFNKNKTKLIRFVSSRTVTSYVVPETVTEISTQAFIYVKWLKSITLPVGLETIGMLAFGECEMLTEIDIPSTVKEIGNGAFMYCSSLGSISLPYGIESLSKAVFADCVKLSEIIIPDSVATIKSNAFENCINIYTITMTPSVSDIGANAFLNCSSLTRINYTGNEGQLRNINIVSEGNEALINAGVYYNYIYSIPTTELTLNFTELKATVGEQIQLLSRIYPANSTNTELIWSSSNEEIATVQNGIVTLLNSGTTVITAKCVGTELSASCIITSLEQPKPKFVISNVKKEQKITFSIDMINFDAIQGKIFVLLYNDKSIIERKTYDAASKIDVTFETSKGNSIKVFNMDLLTVRPLCDYKKIDI